MVIAVQLQKARKFLAFSVHAVAQAINVSPRDIDDWEAGIRQPGLQQLEALANLYGREIDYFLRETPSLPAVIAFRGKPRQSLRDLSDDTRAVLARFDELCRTAVEFEELLQRGQKVRFSRVSENVPPEIVAQRIREQFALEDKPVANLRDLLENAGVRIFEMPIPNDELSGFSFWNEKYGPCILVHAKDVSRRRNFTLAHELAHLIYGHGSSACLIPLKISEAHGTTERRANRFAAELLLPKTGVVNDFRKGNLPRIPSEQQLDQLSRKWGVSVQALGYRLEDLNLVEQGLTDKLVEKRPGFFRRPRTPTWERRLGKRFLETSIEAYRKNLISVGKLAHAWQVPIRKALEKVETEG